MIDAIVVHDVRPFWQAVIDGSHETIVHAWRGGRWSSVSWPVDRLPKNLFDVQLAAGLAGIEYPAGYGTLVAKLLGESSQKQETRTDWRRRPLSKRQIDYAVQDVYYLGLIRDRLHARLGELGRQAWMKEETESWCEELIRATSSERWRRVSGTAGLDQRGLAIVHELWKWRDGEAKHRDQPARRVLRDDLIIELAKRQTADVKRIRACAAWRRGDLVRRIDEIAACIQRAMALPGEQCPPRSRGRRRRSFRYSASSSLPPWPASVARPTWRRTWSGDPTTSAIGSPGGWRHPQAGTRRAGAPEFAAEAQAGRRLAGRIRGPAVRRFAFGQDFNPHRRPGVGVSADFGGFVGQADHVLMVGLTYVERRPTDHTVWWAGARKLTGPTLTVSRSFRRPAAKAPAGPRSRLRRIWALHYRRAVDRNRRRPLVPEGAPA